MLIAQDKLIHLLAGGCVAATASPFGGVAAMLAVCIAGVGKEVYDHFYAGTVDIYDAVATIVGGAGLLLWLTAVAKYVT